MSWNVLIYKEDQSPLGPLDEVRSALSDEFVDLEWNGPDECALVADGGFILELEDDPVKSIWSRGGFNHLSELARVCKKQGWMIADAQEAEDLDLDDPYSLYPPEHRPPD